MTRLRTEDWRRTRRRWRAQLREVVRLHGHDVAVLGLAFVLGALLTLQLLTWQLLVSR